MSPKPSPLREQALLLLRQGKSAAEVSRVLGAKMRTVEKWRASLGLSRPGERGPDQGPREPRGEVLAVLDLLLQGESVREIAGAFGRSEQAIRFARKLWLTDGPE